MLSFSLYNPKLNWSNGVNTLGAETTFFSTENKSTFHSSLLAANPNLNIAAPHPALPSITLDFSRFSCSALPCCRSPSPFRWRLPLFSNRLSYCPEGVDGFSSAGADFCSKHM